MGSRSDSIRFEYGTDLMKTNIRNLLQSQHTVRLRSFLTKRGYLDLYRAMKTAPYRHTSSPLKESYTYAQLPSENVLQEISNFLKSVGIRRVVWKALKLRWKNYTLLTDEPSQSGIDVLLDMTSHWNPSWGGMFHYVAKNGTVTVIPPEKNSVTIIKRSSEKPFIKYMNHRARGHQRLILLGTVN